MNLVRISKFMSLATNSTEINDDSMEDIVMKHRNQFGQFIEQLSEVQSDHHASIPRSEYSVENEKILSLYLMKFVNNLNGLSLDDSERKYFLDLQDSINLENLHE